MVVGLRKPSATPKRGSRLPGFGVWSGIGVTGGFGPGVTVALAVALSVRGWGVKVGPLVVVARTDGKGDAVSAGGGCDAAVQPLNTTTSAATRQA